MNIFLVFPPNLLDLACQTFQWGRQKQPTHEAAASFALKLLGTKQFRHKLKTQTFPDTVKTNIAARHVAVKTIVSAKAAQAVQSYPASKGTEKKPPQKSLSGLQLPLETKH